MPELVKDPLRAWFADEKPLIEAVSDWLAGRSQASPMASGVRFVAHSVGGYVLVRGLLEGVTVVVHLWQTSPQPYSLVLLALQALLVLYATVKIGEMAENLSDIRTTLRAGRIHMTIDTRPATPSCHESEREGQE